MTQRSNGTTHPVSARRAVHDAGGLPAGGELPAPGVSFAIRSPSGPSENDRGRPLGESDPEVA